MTKKQAQELEKQQRRETIQRFASLLGDALSGSRPMLDLTFKAMFGGAGFYVNGVIFAAWFGDGVALKLPEKDRAELLAAIPGSSVGMSPQYIEIPDELLTDREKVEDWVVRAADLAAG